MAESTPPRQSQSQENVVSGVHFGDGDNNFTFAPVQIETQIQTQIVQVSADQILKQEFIKASPYQGLRRFNIKDSNRFFGRATAIADLQNTVNQNNLTLVLGASGSGKSSLVRAGLIPSIAKSLDLQTLYSFVFTPTQDPFDALYRCLRNEEKDYSFSSSAAHVALEAQKDTLQKTINTLKKKDERWLIFIDQFEELFTVCKDEDKRSSFIAGLMEVAKAGEATVKIVLAMRADFLGQFTTRPEFRSIDQKSYYIVHPMYPDELKQAIERPAMQHGVVFENGLIKQMIEDVEGQKGYLPLLQYALNLLWIAACKTLGADGRPQIEDRTLHQASYNLLGGVRGALQNRISAIYDSLDQEKQESAKRIFLNLVDIVDSDTGRKTVSRRAYRNEFTGEPLLHVLDTFIDEDLLVSGSEFLEEYTSGEYNSSLLQVSTVEIAHEILIHSWNELSKWLEQEEEIVILRNWLLNEVKRWERIRLENSAEAKEELLKGSRLEQIVEARRRDAFQNIGGLRQVDHDFIDASLEEDERQKNQEQERKRKELEAAVALETEQKRNQILDKALSEAKTTLDEAKKQRRNIISKGLMAFGIISAATIAVSVTAVVNGKKLAKSEIGSRLVQASNSTRRQFPSGELDALVAAMENAQQLKTLVKADNRISNYPTLGPFSTLHYILSHIHEENYFQGDQRQIKSVSFNASGQSFATSGTDGTIKVWDLSGQLLSQWDSQQGIVNHLTFTPDDQQIITAGVDGTVQIRDLSGKLIHQWNAHSRAGINQLSVISNTNSLITAGGDGYIRRWDFSGTQQAEWKATAGDDGVLGLAVYSAGQKIMSSGDRTGTIKLWDFSGKLLDTWQANQSGPVLGVALSDKGQYAASVGTDGIGRLWALSDEGEERSLDSATELIGHTGNITAVDFSDDGQYLLTAGQDATVRVWDVSGQQTALLRGHSALVRSAHFDPKGQRIVSAGNDRSIRLWNLRGNTAVQVEASAQQADVNSISFHPQTPQIAATGDDGKISLWNLSGEPQKSWQARRGKQFSINFSPDGQSLVVSGDNDRVRIWSVAGELGTLLNGHQGSVKDVSFSPDGTAIATAGADGTARVWTPSGEEIALFSDHEGEVTSVSFSADSQQVASAGDDGTVRLWHIATKAQKALFTHTGKVNSVTFAPKGGQLAAAGANGEIRIWDTASGNLVLAFSTFQTAINRIQFSPDGFRIASAGADGTIKVWDTSGRQLYEQEVPSKGKPTEKKSQPFWDTAFSPEGSTLAAAAGGSVYLWPNQDLDGLMAEGCQWLNLYLKARPDAQKSFGICQGPQP